MIYNFLRSHSLVLSLSIYAETFFAGLNCLIYSLNINHESPSSLFHLEILNSDFLTKFWRNYRQSLQRLSTRVCKYFRHESMEGLSDFGGNYAKISWESPNLVFQDEINCLDFRDSCIDYISNSLGQRKTFLLILKGKKTKWAKATNCISLTHILLLGWTLRVEANVVPTKFEFKIR